MRVLVAGGTGFVGTVLCSELADRDHEVTALARTPSEADLPDDVAAVEGDVTDYGSIASAVADRDVVVNLVARSPLFKAAGGEHERIHLGGTENLVRAAEEHGVERFVQMSALDADPDGPTAFLRAKGRAEGVVRRSDLEWVIVRPSIVFGDGGEFVGFTKRAKRMFAPGLPIAPLPGGGKTPFQPIWVEDLAPMLADVVEDDAHAGGTYELGGPEVVTLAEVTRLAFRADGTSVRVVPIPMPIAGAGLTVLGVLPPFPFGRDQYRALRVDNTVAENDVAAFGSDPGELTTLREYLGLTT